MAGQHDRELMVLADLVELLHAMGIASRADDPGMRFFASTTREYLEGLHARMAAHGLTLTEVTAVIRGETTG